MAAASPLLRQDPRPARSDRHLRCVNGDVELTRAGYNLLWDIGLRPPYRLPGQPWTEPLDTPRK